MKQYQFIFYIIVFFSLSINVTAQKNISSDQILPPDPKILIGKLDNGLIYYIRENKRPEKRAELRLVVKAGSVLEDNDQQGLAHFDEHMAFNGTKNFPKHALVDFLEKTGVRFGPELNAYTDFDETVYMLQVPSDSPDVFKKGFNILEEWAHEISFDNKEIDKERGVVIEEWRLRRGADYRVEMKHIPFELYKSRYADRITIGKKEILESCPYDALRKFYRDWYRPDLMAVLAVGDFNKFEVEKLIKDHFTKLKNPKKERKRIIYPVPDHKETLVSIVTDPELTRSSIEVMFKRNDRQSRTALEYRKDIIGNLYDAMLNNRLRELIQQSDPPFLYAYSGDEKYYGDKYVYVIGAGVKESSILNGLKEALKEAFRVKQHGFTSSELERTKIEFLSRMEQYYRERDKTESRPLVEEYTRNFLTEEPIPGIEKELELYKQFLPGITVDELDKLTEERMTEGNRVVTISIPEKTGVRVPTEKEVLELIIDISGKEYEAYADKVNSGPLISRLPNKGKVIKERIIPALGVTEWELSNGARVVLKSTDFKNDEILFSAYSPGGTSVVPDSNFISSTFASTIIGQSGVDGLDLISLQKKTAGKIVNISPSISQIAEGFSGSASPQDIETLFQLVYLYGTSPRKDTTAFASMISRYKAMLQNRNVSPEAAFNDTIQVTATNYHFRSRPVSIPMIEEIDLNKALSFYKDRFADFGDFIFFFVGSFKTDSIKPLIEQYLASLPSNKRNESWKDIGIERPKGVISKKVNKGIEPKSTVNIAFTGTFEWSQQNRYDFNSMIDILNIKLREVLREDKGGTYGVRVSGYNTLYPRKEYNITLAWGCNPDRVDELVNEALLQIDSLRMRPLDKLYIEKAAETQRRTYEVNLKRNTFWLNNLQAYYTNNENPEMILNYPRLVDNLTAANIQEAIKKYFNMDNYIKIVLYPGNKK